MKVANDRKGKWARRKLRFFLQFLEDCVDQNHRGEQNKEMYDVVSDDLHN